jgi:hypothetical protein
MRTLDLQFIGSPSDSVRETQTEDGSALLDIRQGLCLSMNQVGLRIWNLLRQGCSLEQVRTSLCTDFPDIAPDEIRSDVDGYITELGHKGLLIESDNGLMRAKEISTPLAFLQRWLNWVHSRPKHNANVPRFLLAKAFLGLLIFDLVRLERKFAVVHRFVHDWQVASRSTSVDAVEDICRAINYACIWYPKHVLCLQRSTVTTCLLRSCGIPAQMVLGAKKCPFEAHAWTEIDGQPINERRDVIHLYLVWDRS